MFLTGPGRRQGGHGRGRRRRRPRRPQGARAQRRLPLRRRRRRRRGAAGARPARPAARSRRRGAPRWRSRRPARHDAGDAGARGRAQGLRRARRHPRLVDGGRLLEYGERWARNVVCAFARLDGRAVGIVANQPRYLGGVLDAEAAPKAARFVRTCHLFGLPLVVLVDTPGFMPGTRQEPAGVIRHGAKLVHAFAEASVPKVTVVLRKAFGGAFIAMNAKRPRRRPRVRLAAGHARRDGPRAGGGDRQPPRDRGRRRPGRRARALASATAEHLPRRRRRATASSTRSSPPSDTRARLAAALTPSTPARPARRAEEHPPMSELDTPPSRSCERRTGLRDPRPHAHRGRRRRLRRADRATGTRSTPTPSGRARRPFGERVAHGMLVSRYAVGLVPFDPERVVALRAGQRHGLQAPGRASATRSTSRAGRSSLPRCPTTPASSPALSVRNQGDGCSCRTASRCCGAATAAPADDADGPARSTSSRSRCDRCSTATGC